MKRGIVVLTVGLACASPVHAAPGDPRLIEGVLEWPAQLTVEPFLVIRTNDGGGSMPTSRPQNVLATRCSPQVPA